MTSAFLAIRNVTKRFGGLVALDAVNFDVGAGELVSLIGPNGAGKTTLFNVLTGQLAPTSGQVLFNGRDIGRIPPNGRAKLGFGRTFQISQTLTSLSVLENAMVGAFLHGRFLRRAGEEAAEALAKVGLRHRASTRAGHLTLGERRRLEVARALAMKPRILLLDEVMAGLNQTEVNAMVDLVQELSAAGYTIIVIEHNLKVVRIFSRRVIVLNRGSLLSSGAADAVLQDPAVIEAYVGKRRA